MAYSLAECLTLQIQYDVDGNRLSSSLSYASPGGATFTDPQNLVDSFIAETFASWRAVVSSDVSFQKMYALRTSVGVCMPGTKLFAGVNGTSDALCIPSNLALVIQLRQTELASDFNGRVFISGLPESKIVSGLVQGAFATGACQTLASKLQNPLPKIGGGYYYPVVMHRTAAGVPITPIGLEVSQAVVIRALGTQRRRKTEKRGLNL